MIKWNINDLLSVGESVLYNCTIEDEEYEAKIKLYLTNYRIIWIRDGFVDSRMLKFISKFGVFIGYDDYAEDDDIGTGEYGVYFGDFNGYESVWFYSRDVWHSFYTELTRALFEE